VRGLVHEQGGTTAVPEAIVSMSGKAGGYATGADGKFETNNVDPGNYTFNIKAPGYKDGTCSATVAPGGASPGAPGAAPGMLPPAGAPSTAPGMLPPPPPPGAPGAAPGAPAAAPGQPATGPNYTDIDCPLEALPKMGGIQGRVIDAESNAGIGGATVVATDGGGKEFRATTDGSGNFKFDGVKPGTVTIKLEADKFFAHTESVEVKPREDSKPTIGMSARPKVSNVVVGPKEITIKKQIHFETDSAAIKGDSTQLMEEITDAILKTPAIKKCEIQGHTDNTGTPDHNMQLSQARAESVKTWLVSHGVDSSRLDAKGYGQTRPRVPNVTAANRGMNRRVQFMITERTP
jgi:outer membrane protein OmpA-like peptidoglycan-associated protein